MPITFGSVGDILAICALVKDCVDALSDTNGSAPQYQAVVRELEILQKALLEVGVLSRTHAITPELTALFISADTTIERCRQTLAQFKVKVQPYDKHLSASPRGSPVQKICNRNAKKLLWHIKMKDEVTRFRAEVVAFSVSIHQILSAATMHTVTAHADRLDSKIDSLQQDNQCSFDRQDEKLKEIRSKLVEVNDRISAGNNLIVKLALAARKSWFLQLGNELKALMLKTMAMNLAIYASVDKVNTSLQDLRSALPTSSLVTPLTHERVFYLEDAIGRVSTITLDFITSHDALKAVLRVRFQGMSGSKKVLKNEYALQNRATGKDVDNSQRWEGAFLPGLWYNMSMIFQLTENGEAEESEQDACPRCGEKSNQPQGLKIKCSVCNQEYQYDRTGNSMIKDVEASQNQGYTYAPEAPDSSVNEPRATLDSTSTLGSPHGTTPEPEESEHDDDPASFNHVRIKMRKSRHKSGSRTNESSLHDELEDSEWHRFEVVEEDDNSVVNQTVPTYQNSRSYGYNDLHEPVYPVFNYTEKNARHTTKSSPTPAPMPPRRKAKSRPIAKNPTVRGMMMDGHDREVRGETSARKMPASEVKKLEIRKATETEARRAGIPAGYSYRNWDPTEEPIMLLGSVFDAKSLGKWIHDWTVYHYGANSPCEEKASELWLLLIQLATNLKWAEEEMSEIKSKESYEMIEDFLETGERLWIRFAKLLKICEEHMWGRLKRNDKEARNVDKDIGIEFLLTIWGLDRQLERTEKLMTGMRLWSLRFDANCVDILKHPSRQPEHQNRVLRVTG